MDTDHAKSDILKICLHLHNLGMLAAADGNVSYRLSDQCILMTPAGRNKRLITTNDLAVMTLDSDIISGTPSSERLMHLKVYRTCPEAKVVIHAHPATAIAWSIAKPEFTELPIKSMPEAILGVGAIPIVPYARPGTEALASGLEKIVPRHRALILARHGALSWGTSVEEAINGMERLEHVAKVLAAASSLGELSELTNDEVSALIKLRQQEGMRSL